MRYQEIKHKPSVGREFQHLEDLVFIEGSSGAIEAIRILENIDKAYKGITVKWDGNPTIYWGRNLEGKFVLVNKNAWGKTECTSPDMLEEFILTSGKGEPWRKEFAESLVKIWPILEAETSEWVHGYAYGDILFSPSRPAKLVGENIEFTPNKVTYRVKTDSELGKRLAEAKVCVAVHKAHRKFGEEQAHMFHESNFYNCKELFVINQHKVSTMPVVEQAAVAKLREMVTEEIDQFLAPRQGLSDLKNIIYTYVNQTSKARKLDTLGESFFDWLSTSKVSKPKQARIVALAEEHPTALPTIFSLVKGIMKIKDSVIEQLDNADSEIAAQTLNESGGEGYMMLDYKIKLVPRHRWVPD